MKKVQSFVFILIAALGLTLAATDPARAQKKLQTSPGGYHGELDFPISWKRYYSYAEWTTIMHDLQKQYRNLADIESIGKSRMGRDQFLMTITAKSTGAAADKPAMWVDGAVHGNEVNGITCSLYTIWYLLTRYDYDPYVHRLVDNCTFYVLPGLNVDANASYVSWPNTPHNPREPYRPEDNDGDGLYDEDRTEDVDGDGELSVMYAEDPAGEYKLSPDKRRFVRVEDDREEVQRFRRIGSEGFDNDGDGLINEDDIGGPDPNRNYPTDWNIQAGNPYPMSERCTRNAFTFMLAHTNIFASFHFHNTGRLIMTVLPPRSESAPPRDPQAAARFAQRLEAMRKENKYAVAFDIQVPEDYQEDLAAQTAISAAGARILKNYRPTIAGGSGQANASSYGMLGAYAYLVELWGSPVDFADTNGDGRVSDEEYLKFIDIELSGEGWITPHKVQHPDLGEIWIGGSMKKHIMRTPPSRYIEMEAMKNSQFVLYCASQFPNIEFDDITVTAASGDLYWVDVVLKNDRLYPTVSDRMLKLKRAARDTLVCSPGSGVTLVEVPKGLSVLDPLNRNSRAVAIANGETAFRLKGKEKLRFRALIASGKKGRVTFSVKSAFGGSAKKSVTIPER